MHFEDTIGRHNVCLPLFTLTFGRCYFSERSKCFSFKDALGEIAEWTHAGMYWKDKSEKILQRIGVQKNARNFIMMYVELPAAAAKKVYSNPFVPLVEFRGWSLALRLAVARRGDPGGSTVRRAAGKAALTKTIVNLKFAFL